VRGGRECEWQNDVAAWYASILWLGWVLGLLSGWNIVRLRALLLMIMGIVIFEYCMLSIDSGSGCELQGVAVNKTNRKMQ